MYRSSVYDVLIGAVVALIALRYATAAVDPAKIFFTYYNSLDSSGVQVFAGHKNERHTVYIIPNWNEMINTSWIQQLKISILSRLSADVILVDWSTYYMSDYKTTCEAVSGVGDVVGYFAAYSDNLFDTQMQGYGMGAHVAGIAGKRVQAVKGTDNKIVRIVGLEPSKNWFENQPVDNRLVASDAMVVLVFHTTRDSMPYISGTVGVFFNYCISSGLLELLLELLGLLSFEQPNCLDSDCSSSRAVLYFIESTKTRKFLAVKCDNCSSYLLNSCPTTKYVVGAQGTNTPGSYYLETTGEAPWYIE